MKINELDEEHALLAIDAIQDMCLNKKYAGNVERLLTFLYAEMLAQLVSLYFKSNPFKI